MEMMKNTMSVLFDCYRGIGRQGDLVVRTKRKLKSTEEARWEKLEEELQDFQVYQVSHAYD